MSSKFTHVETKATILPKITERMETAGYNDKDIMAIRAVVIYEGISDDSRQLLLQRDDLERAIRSLEGKPLRILFDGVNPTGHGYNKETNTFSPLVANIGFINWAWGEVNEETNRYEVICDICMWQDYYPEIALRLRQLHESGELKFSFEMERDFEMTPEGYKKCFNIHFKGVAVVKNPAFEETRSLLVAEILNEGGKNMDEILKLLDGLKGTLSTEIAEQFKSNLGVLNAKIEDLTGKLEGAEKSVTDLKVEVADKDGTIKTLEADRDKYKGIVDTAEKAKVGAERLEKLSKYGKVEKTTDELAEMDKEAFVTLLEEMVSNYNPQENAENDGAMGVNFERTSKNKVDRKAKLLSLVEGFNC